MRLIEGYRKARNEGIGLILYILSIKCSSFLVRLLIPRWQLLLSTGCHTRAFERIESLIAGSIRFARAGRGRLGIRLFTIADSTLALQSRVMLMKGLLMCKHVIFPN